MKFLHRILLATIAVALNTPTVHAQSSNEAAEIHAHFQSIIESY